MARAENVVTQYLYNRFSATTVAFAIILYAPPHYDLIAEMEKEGADFYDAVNIVIDSMMKQLHKSKAQRVEDHKHGKQPIDRERQKKQILNKVMANIIMKVILIKKANCSYIKSQNCKAAYAQVP